MGVVERGWEGLVGDLYLAAVDPAAEGRLPGRLAGVTGGVIASMWQVKPRDFALVGGLVSNVPSEAAAAYQAHYHQYDPWKATVQRAPFNVVLRGAEIVDDATLARSVYYNEFAVPLDVHHVIGAQISIGETVGVVSILRARRAEAFGEEAVAALARAMPHVAGAFALRRQLGEVTAGLRAAALGAALEGIGCPAAVLAGDGAVLRFNAHAERIEAVRRALLRRGGASAAVQLGARFAALVADAARGGAGGTFRLTEGGRDYRGTVSPLPGALAALAGSRGRVLVVLREVAPPGPGVLAGLFGWTGSEAAVAVALAEGLSPAEIAASRGVKVSTVRTLLVRAQEKADCRNLRDLVRVVVGLG